MESIVNSVIFFVLGAFVSFYIAERRIFASFGSQEMQDYNAIKDLEQKIIDCEIDIEKENDENIKKHHEEKLDILKCQYRNTFEILCERYLAKGKKIDKENFRKVYRGYIIDLIESDIQLKNNKRKYNQTTSTFDATIKVYYELINV